MISLQKAPARVLTVLLAGAALLVCSGCPRNQTTLDDRPMERRPSVETSRPVDRENPWRP